MAEVGFLCSSEVLNICYFLGMGPELSIITSHGSGPHCFCGAPLPRRRPFSAPFLCANPLACVSKPAFNVCLAVAYLYDARWLWHLPLIRTTVPGISIPSTALVLIDKNVSFTAPWPHPTISLSLFYAVLRILPP
jgi:hypothetical protein